MSLYMKLYSVFPFQTGIFYITLCIRFIHVFVCLDKTCLFSRSIVTHSMNIVCLLINLLKNMYCLNSVFTNRDFFNFHKVHFNNLFSFMDRAISSKNLSSNPRSTPFSPRSLCILQFLL